MRVVFVAQRPKRPLFWRKTYRKTITKPQAPSDGTFAGPWVLVLHREDW